MTNSKMSDPSKAIGDLHKAYGSEWPPKPDFASWPASWAPYQTICDKMPDKLHGTDPDTFRQHLTAELENKVDLRKVMEDIRIGLRKDNRSMLGFLGCLAFLKNAYRWGALPVQQKERDRTSLSFPPAIDLPMTEISWLHGVEPVGNVFNLNIANTVYENDRPVGMRFHFNSDPQVLSTEQTFFISFTVTEIVFQPAVQAIKKFIELTEDAKNDQTKAKENLQQRLEQLNTIHNVVKSVIQVLKLYTSKNKINPEDWAKYVQAPATWGLEGKEGASGGETLTFQLLDEFLYVPGKCLLYEIKQKRREHMPASVREVVLATKIANPEERFNSYIDAEQTELLKRARMTILNSLLLWRLGHKAVVKRTLGASKGLASSLEKKMEGCDSMAEKVSRQLQERVAETRTEAQKERKEEQEPQASHLSTPMAPVSSMSADIELCECVWCTWMVVADEEGEIRIEDNVEQPQQTNSRHCIFGAGDNKDAHRYLLRALSIEVEIELHDSVCEKWVWVQQEGVSQGTAGCQ